MKVGDRIRVIDEDSMLCGEFGTIAGVLRNGLLEIQLEGWTQPDWVVFLHPQCVELSLRYPL